MEAVSELQVQRVFARCQCQFGLKRGVAIMEMLVVSWDNLAGRNEIGIDEYMHVPRTGYDIA